MKAVWYVTRKYPPSVGGMERLAYQIATALHAGPAPVVIASSGSRLGLPFFVAWAAIRIAWGRFRRNISVLYLGDPVLAILGSLVRERGIPLVVTVHGLDILYPSPMYQAYLQRWFWGRFDCYIAISHFVEGLLRERGMLPSRIEIVPPGIDVPDRAPAAAPPRATGPVLLAIGRLVPRKGLAWFVEAVAPRLFASYPNATLVIAGSGPEQDRIAAAATGAGISRNVELLGYVNDQQKRDLLAACDAVIMPNIPTPGDVEGFGLVALEAGAAGKPVFVADLEGLRDAVREGENGWRLAAGDADAWTIALLKALDNLDALRAAGACAYRCVRDHYSWREVGKQYARIVDRYARA